MDGAERGRRIVLNDGRGMMLSYENVAKRKSMGQQKRTREGGERTIVVKES